jgi:Leucine-rich repeat (LRR) protein
MLVLLLVGFSAQAQDDDTYQIALERIEDAAFTYAIILDLSDLNLTELPPEIWQLVDLRRLFLDGNQLASLSPEIWQLRYLRELRLSNNHLTSLPPEIGQLTGLEQVGLYSNRLTSLPREIGQLTLLESLNLTGNQLTSLPVEIGQLTRLESLNLSSNHLLSLPIEIGQLRYLQTLDLSDNQLTSLPAEIGQLSNLDELYLNDNGLTSLPREIGQLSNLQTLELSNNDLARLPGEFTHLTGLLRLTFDGNPVSIPDNIYGIDEQLEYLSIANVYQTAQILVSIVVFLILVGLWLKYASLRKYILGATIGGLAGGLLIPIIINFLFQSDLGLILSMVCFVFFIVSPTQFGIMSGIVIGLKVVAIISTSRQKGKSEKSKTGYS